MKKTLSFGLFQLLTLAILAQNPTHHPAAPATHSVTPTIHPATPTPHPTAPTTYTPHPNNVPITHTNTVVYNNTGTQPIPVKMHYDEFWISGCIGAGAVVSTNIINSGAVLPSRMEFMWQKRHRRLGFGFGKELYLTPQSLINLIIRQPIGISKLYFVYETFIFRNSPINLGFSSHLGFFGPSGGNVQNQDSTKASGGWFANAGPVLELGIRPFYIFVRPDIEFQSWSGFHKQLQATATVGVRLKFLSEAEKERRAAEKAARKKKSQSSFFIKHNRLK